MGEMLTEGDLEFDFSAAILSEQFDNPETHKLSHCMKAVDFIVEWDREFWFVEVKNPSKSSIPPEMKRDKLNDFISKVNNETLFSNELGPKVKDSFLYLHLSDRLPEKPIKYLVLIAIGTPDPALLLRATECLKRSSCLPGPERGKWKKPYLDGIMVFNEQTWNERLKQCPVSRKQN
jgi:hypothetical protein